MRKFSLAAIANALAWGAFLALAAGAIALALRLGPLGVALLGLMTLLVSSQFTLNDETPTWSVAAFRARMATPTSPEQRASRQAERQAAFAPIRFIRRCGLVLLVAGAAAFIWQSR